MSPRHGLRLNPGETVFVNGELCELVRVLNLEQVIVRSNHDKLKKIVPIEALRQRVTSEIIGRRQQDLEGIPEKQWEIAESRFDAIEPLLNHANRIREMVKERARTLGMSHGPLYHWIRRFESSGLLSSLLPHERSGGRGKSRMSSDREELLSKTIESHFLMEQRLTPQAVFRELKIRAIEAGIKCPSIQSVRSRINAIDPELVARRRYGVKGQRKFKPTIGSFPNVEHPYAVVQVDHTELDIELVDEIRREDIGRPWITLAIDVYSRMVAGFYISLDPPGDISTGLCLVHAILPKRDWLDKRSIDGQWPCQGLMLAIHTDNAKEFRGKTLARAAAEYGIKLIRRPVRMPHFGGHIERLIGTTLRMVHTLPGATFSNVAEKGEYDSAAKATFTIAELERILAHWFTGVYHQTVHRGLLTTPLEKYRSGMLGYKALTGESALRIPDDPDRLKIDFLPSIERCILPSGVVIDDVFYWSDVLRPWINAMQPNSKSQKRRFLFKRDPRDISVIQFLDPYTNSFHDVPYRNITLPPISVWELRAARKKLKEQGRKAADEHSLFEAHKAINAERRLAAGKTRGARREEARQAGRAKATEATVLPAEIKSEANAADDDLSRLYTEPIQAFKVRER